MGRGGNRAAKRRKSELVSTDLGKKTCPTCQLRTSVTGEQGAPGNAETDACEAFRFFYDEISPWHEGCYVESLASSGVDMMKNESVFFAVVFFLLSVALLNGCSDTVDTGPSGAGVDAGSVDTGSPGADLAFPDAAQGEAGADTSTTADLPTETNPNAMVQVSNLELIENAANKLSFYAEWETDAPSSTRLDVSCSDYYDTSFTDSGTRTDHEVYVMGLVQNTVCTATAYAQDDQGRLSSDSTSITIGTLPDTFPELTVASSVPGQIQTGWTLFNLHNGPRDIPQSVVIVDAQGRYRWYYTASGGGYGLDNDVRTVPEGVLMQVPPRIVDWEGSIVWERNLPAHHDIRPIGSNGNLIFLRQ